MKSKNKFVFYSSIGILAGILLGAFAMFFAGAGHSPHVEFWTGCFKFGLFITAMSAGLFVIAVIQRIVKRG